MKLKLIQKKVETKDVESFVFEPSKPIKWQAGQFLHYVLDHKNPDDRGIERWFTISNAPFEDCPRITTRITDPDGSTFKKALLSMKSGDFIEGDNPEGDFIYDKKAQKHILIAGGIGVTPYRSMLLQLDHDDQPIDAELLYANRDSDLVFDAEFSQLENKYPDFHILRFTDDKYIEKADLAKYINEKSILFYISGPKKMVDIYQAMLAELGIPENQIILDYFPGYGAYN
ncbi:MAG TPA: FAD-dependent oxidoreductase [Patescibacteria group bacterium]|nr:FAD-dependent oxidoreductase [Patescibacteria group bacterium]